MPWSASDDATLRRVYPTHGAAAVAKLIGRTVHVVRSRAEALGLRRARPTTLHDIRARCRVNPATHCWEWLGAMSAGQPRIWAFDARKGEKASLPGTLAVWQIAFGRRPPAGNLIYRACGCTACLNPAHLRDGPKTALGEAIRISGRWAGGPLSPGRRKALAMAHATRGITPTAPHIVLAIRAASPSITTTALALQHGISVQTASAIRTGKSHRHLLPEADQAERRREAA